METIRKKVSRFQWLWPALVLTVALSVGCGQKGPLYYPSEAEKASLKAEKEARKSQEAEKQTPKEED
uniref:Predicted small lipoprotein YifL n=1 Tax=Candidatus Kentrum sp. TC TaxID=2126339 RepID=A0A450YZ90_9GAMM|nr:MAG: Predicted small lipoprotein YifL [Candidatus Kentron sp. TC]VFK46837.1 MAG: Predicted small lipoprotein YifL [Candidatus Kentron sp. TC]VFK55598.1 MAG: Predicted small lipoprotein YifL [Candidatus Kentron sp. TC]